MLCYNRIIKGSKKTNREGDKDMKKTIITVKANSYNDFCYKLRSMYIWDVTVKCAGCRYKLYDNISGKIVASYDERKDHGLVYNYNLGRN